MEKQDDTLKPVAENGNVAASSGEYNWVLFIIDQSAV